MAGATAPAFSLARPSGRAQRGDSAVLVVPPQPGYITPTLNTSGAVTDLRMQLQTALATSYTLERELGRGGMAAVYLAQDLKHDRRVALKLLHPELAASLGPERFLREIKLAARLQHPHILTVYDSGEAAGQLWFTMPYVEGGSLRDRLRRETQLPVGDALRIAIETARALDYAHRQGVVHRDIKPENILLTKDGDTLVADFGIACALAGGSDDRRTQTGMVVGTPAYMSPEQAAGERSLDARTDVYSLATVLYEMLAGEPPFTGPTAQAINAKRLVGEVPGVRQVRPSVTESVEQAVTRALAPIAADRFASAAELARALAQTGATAPTGASAGQPASSASTSTPRPRRRRVQVGVLTLALGLLLFLSVLFAWRRSRMGAEASDRGPKRLAVLPFENLGDSADAYFADGITNEVRGKLSQIAGLAVIARASSNDYRKATKAPQQIAHELGADYLLTATVQWQKSPGALSRVRVSAELVRVEAGAAPTTRWQQPFDAALTDVFQVQTDIASKVAGALNVALGEGERRVLSQRPTASLAAYDAYVRGEEISGAVSVFEPMIIRRAVTSYEEAVTLDSTFAAAWAQLSRAHSLLYYNSVPLPAEAQAARTAAERALALAPDRPEGRWALGDYYAAVLRDHRRALKQYELALRSAPRNAELLAAYAVSQQGTGAWDDVLRTLARAQSLDPRSTSTAWKRAQTLLYLRRYDEALTAIDEALALAPSYLTLIQQKAMVYLARGDLAGAREVIRAAPPDISPTTLVAFMGAYWDLYWVLDASQQSLLVRLTPRSFDENRAAWGLTLAETYALRGDHARSLIYADSARLAFGEQLRTAPRDGQLHVLYGLALAYFGKKAAALREGERGTSLAPLSQDAYNGAYFQHQLARIYLLVGEPEKALDILGPLLEVPYYLSPGWLRIDPTFAPLRGNPRFERLVAGG